MKGLFLRNPCTPGNHGLFRPSMALPRDANAASRGLKVGAASSTAILPRMSDVIAAASITDGIRSGAPNGPGRGVGGGAGSL